MNAVESDVNKLVDVELAAANQKFRPFASAHEGYAVVLEELDKVETEYDLLKVEIRQSMWGRVKNNHKIEDDDIWYALDHAKDLAVEAIQVAAMLRKFHQGQDNGWSEDKT